MAVSGYLYGGGGVESHDTTNVSLTVSTIVYNSVYTTYMPTLVYTRVHTGENMQQPVLLPSSKAYNAALTSEIQMFDALLRELVDTIPEPTQTVGRPRLPLKDQVFCAVQKVYSQLSCRRAYGVFENAASRAQLERPLHFNVPSKVLNRADLTPLLHALIAQSALPLTGIESDFAIDSSGFRTTNFGAYCAGRYGATKPHVWLKVHVCVGTRTHIVTRAIVTDANGADAVQFEPLLRQTAEAGFAVRGIMADKAYSSRLNHDVAADVGATAYIPFKSNASGNSKGSSMWRKAYHFFNLHREEFEERYHRRSNVESVFSAIKRKFGEALKSKNRVAQENELLCKILAYNITVLIQEMHQSGVRPDFLRALDLADKNPGDGLN